MNQTTQHARPKQNVRSLIIGVAATVTMGLMGSGCVASIRPAAVSEDGADPIAVTRGRALLEEAAHAHGRDAWERAQTLSYEMTDRWQGLLGKFGNPWPEHEIKVRMAYRLGSFDGRATFLDGDERGTTWGLQAWRTYEQQGGAAPTFEDNDDARFIIPAVQYLLEFPMRASSIELVTYAGTEVIDGVTYDLVFATWGSLEAHTGNDQYLAYINRETKMVEKLQYTIREFARFAKGTIHYSDFQDFGGMKIPLLQVVSGSVEDDTVEDCIHVMNIDSTSVQIDGLPPSTFAVDPELPRYGDEKPASG